MKEKNTAATLRRFFVIIHLELNQATTKKDEENELFCYPLSLNDLHTVYKIIQRQQYKKNSFSS